MSEVRITQPMLDRTLHVIDNSGILDLLAPPRTGQAGRRGKSRENLRLFLIGAHIAARMGIDTTIRNAHRMLTEALPREAQWEIGVLRPHTTRSQRGRAPFDPSTTPLVVKGKRRKRIWDDCEEVSYDDLHNAVNAMLRRLNYGPASAPADLEPADREARRNTLEQVVEALVRVTTIPATTSTYAIDATGQWAWERGPKQERKKVARELKKSLRAGTDPREHLDEEEAA